MLFALSRRLELCVQSLVRRKIALSFDRTFAELTTMGVGGAIAVTAYPANLGEFVFCVNEVAKASLPSVVIGYGSNVVAWDGDFVGVVVCVGRFCGYSVKGNRLVASAGASAAKIGWELQKRGLRGGEFLCCLPATVGGAVCSNAGCFGGEMQAVVTAVWAISDEKIKKFSAKDCGFGKRTSAFRQLQLPVVQVEARFGAGNAQTVLDKIQSNVRRKRQSQPLGEKSAGSMFFHDRVAVSRLIDEDGLKGLSVGGASVSKKHAGFVLNIDKATAKDIYLLTRQVRERIACRFGVRAKVEPTFVNFPPDLKF